MGRFKKYIAILLMFSVYMMPFNARAAGMSGWTLSNPLAQGASTLYNGAKNVIINGKNVAKTSIALITPNASQVAKLLGKGVAGVALSVAVQEMLGAVDWILDPANNSIVYKQPDTTSSATPPDYREYFGIVDFYGYQNAYTTDLTNAAKTACTREGSLYGYTYVSHTISRMYVPGETGKVTALCNVKDSSNYESKRSVSFNYYYVASNPPKPEQSDDTKSIPLDVVAQKVISNAEAGNSDAQVATTAAAADIVNDAQKDDAKARPIVNQLEANSKTETDADSNTATGEAKPNTETGGTDLALEFPTFCGWAPQVCEAAQVVINFPTTLTDWWNTTNEKADSWAKSVSEAWTAVKDWVKEPEKENTEVDIDTPVQTEPDTTISFSTSCPAKIPLTFNWNGQTLDFSFDFTIW
ncbi:MAG: hypothetical protein I4N51_22620, partial [Acinetobacter sp.]|nr:hypothetical protein [Acinetobacter sp.]